MKKNISTFKQFEELELLRASFTTQFFKPHFHEQYALIFLEKGKVDYSYKDKIRLVESGTIMLLNPYEVHTGKSVNGSAWDFRSLYISQDLFKSIYAETTDEQLYPAFAQPVLQDRQFLSHFTNVHEYLLSETQDELARSAIRGLVEDLIKICAFESFQPKWGHLQEKAAAVKAYIEDHFLEQIRLDELEKELGFSKYYLIRLFESVYGLSPIRYTINLRIEEAKRLLYSGMKYTEVAYSTGFYDQSHFIRHFKMIVGVTPKAFC